MIVDLLIVLGSFTVAAIGGTVVTALLVLLFAHLTDQRPIDLLEDTYQEVRNGPDHP